jgi:hypothetical protein
MKAPNTAKKANAEVLDIDNETIAQTGESDTTKVDNINATNASDTTTANYPTATFTLVISDKPNLTKRYDLVDGKVEKTAAGKLSLGTARTVTNPLDELIDDIQKQATPHHALVHGVCGHDEIRVGTKGNESADAISRSREYFSYSNNALLMFDHDPSERGKNFTFENCDDFLNTLAEGHSQFLHAAFVVKPSSSAGIKLNGKLVFKQGGFHAYTVALDGRDILRFTDVLFKRLIIKGHGHAFISKSGSLSVRTIFDNAIYRPEGLDYIAPAVVGNGLTINQPPPQKFPGGDLDTSLMPDLTEAEEVLYQAECNRLIDEAREDAEAVREAYLKVRSSSTGIPIKKLRKQYEQGEKGAIDYEMPLTRNDGTRFCFEDVIADPDAYKDLSMRDPFEPEYGEDKAKLYINDTGSINVHSYCHGKHTYRLFKDGFRYPLTSALKKGTPFKLMGMNEILTQPAPLHWLIEGYMLTGAQAQLIGESTIGKTFSAVDMGLCIATGSKFMGNLDVTQGAVVYINAEGHTGMRWRVYAWMQERGLLDADVPFYLSEQRVDFLNPADVAAAAETIAAKAAKHGGKIAAIFIDTYHRNMTGDENSSLDYGRFQAAVEDLCKPYGAAGLVMHHPGAADKDRGRGSTAMKPSMDTEFLLKKVSKSKNAPTIFKHGKIKDGGPELPDVGYRLKVVTLPWLCDEGKPITSCVAEFYEYDGTAAAVVKRKPVPRNTGLALKSLFTAMNGSLFTTKDRWRDAYFKVHTGTHAAKKVAFSETTRKLVKEGFVLLESKEYRLGDFANCLWTNVRDYVPSSPSQPVA